MKALTLLLLIGSMAGTAVFAQSANDPTTSPEIQLLRVGIQRVSVPGPKWRAVPRADPASLRKQQAEQRQSDPDRSPALHRMSKDAEIATEYNATGSEGSAPVPTKFVASIVVRNIGKKTINAVSWEYLLFETGGVTPVKRYLVRTKIDILPDGVAELSKDVQPKGKEHQAAITRIEYSDGSFWQRPDSK